MALRSASVFTVIPERVTGETSLSAPADAVNLQTMAASAGDHDGELAAEYRAMIRIPATALLAGD